jgi:hypothetical protein
MKRFFCSKCKRIKRVRKLPAGVSADGNPAMRGGVCRRHPKS